MSYVIFGAGAVGTSLAAQFTGAGIAATLVGRGRQLAHLRENGLIYERRDGPHRVRLTLAAIEDLRLTPDDVLILAVKSQDVEVLSRQIAALPVAGGGTAADLPVVALQNGLEAERILARRFARLYAAVVRVPAIYTEVGKVRVLAEPQFASFVLGRFPAGSDPVSHRLTQDLVRAGALVEERDDIRRWKAQKLLHNVRNVAKLYPRRGQRGRLPEWRGGVAGAAARAGRALEPCRAASGRRVGRDGGGARRDRAGQTCLLGASRGGAAPTGAPALPTATESIPVSQARRSPVADHILGVAGGLFYREGIRAVGIDRIIDAADIAKATLYRHYRSKEDLVLAYLGDRHQRVMEGLQEVLAQFAAPRDQLAEIFARLHIKAENPEFRGCAFGLAVAEHGDSERIVALARMHKNAVAEVLLGIARAAGLSDADAVGRHLALLYDGALARRAIYGTPAPMREAQICALALFDGAPRNG